MSQSKQKVSVVDRITAHYESQGLKQINVPEWGDEDGPLVIFFAPFTIKDQGRIDFATRNSESTLDAIIEVLVQKALDEDGAKMFNAGDKRVLRDRADAEVVSRICNQIMGSSTETLEKN